MKNEDNVLVPEFHSLYAGTYHIQLIDGAGCMTDTLVAVLSEDCVLYIPNIFSPNGDGINDEFIINPVDLIDSRIAQFTIYDRWGNQVFEFNNEEIINWNGSHNERPLNSGVYTYILKMEKSSGMNTILKGEITLIR